MNAKIEDLANLQRANMEGEIDPIAKEKMEKLIEELCDADLEKQLQDDDNDLGLNLPRSEKRGQPITVFHRLLEEYLFSRFILDTEQMDEEQRKDILDGAEDCLYAAMGICRFIEIRR